jgi:glycosyltransferase involved in cell wall biosynthesis
MLPAVATSQKRVIPGMEDLHELRSGECCATSAPVYCSSLVWTQTVADTSDIGPRLGLRNPARVGRAGLAPERRPVRERQVSEPERGSVRIGRLGFYLDNFEGGGVQKTTLTLAGALAARGHPVDLLVCRPRGALADQVPRGVEVVGLDRPSAWSARALALKSDPGQLGAILGGLVLAPRPSPTLGWLGPLAAALEARRPAALCAATTQMNIEAVLAGRLAGVGTRIIVSERNALRGGHLEQGWTARFLPALVRRAYGQADAVVAVSDGVADDLAAWSGLPRAQIVTIYNPVVTEELRHLARAPVDHPWFQPGAPPVIMSAGRLGRAKDFPTLIRAFARVRRNRPARLVIFGTGKSEAKTDKSAAALRALAADLGIGDDLALPGFVTNPFAYMARAAIFALSSINEGLPGVLIQAMACGCPVVSTDCPSGPAEILEGGRWGLLVPPGDDAALAEAILATLEAPPLAAVLRERAGFFSVERAVAAYERVMLGDAPLARPAAGAERARMAAF